MKRYEMNKQKEGSITYFFIRDTETWDIVLLPTKYLMHMTKAKCSPNTVRRSGCSILYYLEYIEEKEKKLTDVYEMSFTEQTKYFVEFLYWLKAGKHTSGKMNILPNNGTCNAYLKDVFRFYVFIEEEFSQFGGLKVLSYSQFTAVDSVGLKKTIRSRSFKGYLKEEEHKARTAKKDEIIEILKACTNIRDRLLILLLAETGYRIGEILGINYMNDIDYSNQVIRVYFREDNENGARAKNAEYRSAKISADTFQFLKRQIFDVLEFILENYEPSRAREQKLTGLHIFYEFCRLRKIEDINCLEQVQEEDFQIFLERKIENEQRRNRLRSIVGLACRITFLQTKEIRWDATIWYLEKFKIPKERLNPSDPVERISFREVLHPENRKLLQEYMKYEIGIGEMAISTVYEKFRIIRNFLKEISDEQQKVTTCDAERIDQYLKKRQEDANEAKTFNTQVTSIQYFFKFLEVRGYVDKVPFRAEYYWEKQILVHHDRCVEEDVYMEIIQKLSNFPEHLRMMFLHLWCIGLRISEVCTLKGDAYYRQKGDYWMKIYQVKMKNYKRVPIPEALYDLMQVYLNKNRIAKEDYIFQNRKGGAFSKSTFNEQMKKYCAACDIQNGEYLFKSHDYRHTVATNLYDHGVSRQGIRDYLGHNYEEMTMQYIDYMPKKIARRNEEYFSDEKNSLLSYVQKGEKDERKS